VPRRNLIPLLFFVVPVMMLVVVACGPNLGQAKLCERALFRLVDNPNAIEVVAREDPPGAEGSIRLVYKLTGSQQPAAAKRWIDCRFDDGRSASGRLELIGVKTSTLGNLRLVALVHLRRQMGYRRPPPEPAGK